MRNVVLVEGASDKLALETLARRRDRHLDREGVSIVSIGGAGNFGRALEEFGPRGLDLGLAGLCDAAQAREVGRSLERAGLVGGLEELGFFVCVEDLEDELIRALGGAAVEQVIDAYGDLEAFRTFQRQPAWRRASREEQLRRFLGTRAGRKTEIAALLVDALDLARVPRPLDHVLAFLFGSARP